MTVYDKRLARSHDDILEAIAAALDIPPGKFEEAKQRLADPSSERTILDILQDCGFSTKSNFNRAFRQHVGTTPSAYRKRALDAAAAGKYLK